MLEALLIVAVVIGFFWAARSRELFCISVRDGKLLVVRGSLPSGLLADFQSVLSQPPVRRGTVKGIRQERGGSIHASGDIDEWREQRLRNIFKLYPASQLRAAPVANDRTIGQLLGIAWVAWLLDRR